MQLIKRQKRNELEKNASRVSMLTKCAPRLDGEIVSKAKENDLQRVGQSVAL